MRDDHATTILVKALILLDDIPSAQQVTLNHYSVFVISCFIVVTSCSVAVVSYRLFYYHCCHLLLRTVNFLLGAGRLSWGGRAEWCCFSRTAGRGLHGQTGL